MKQGHFFLIIGPSSVGKATLQTFLFSKIPSLKKSLSITTRKPRASEVNGKDYIFVTKEQYLKELDSGNILMHYVYNANNEFYGTPKSAVIESLENSEIIIDETDILSLREMIDKNLLERSLFTSIFIKSDIDSIKKRLESRSFEDDEIKKRLQSAKEVFKEYESNKDYIDYCVINENLDRAKFEILNIVKNIIETKNLK